MLEDHRQKVFNFFFRKPEGGTPRRGSGFRFLVRGSNSFPIKNFKFEGASVPLELLPDYAQPKVEPEETNQL